MPVDNLVSNWAYMVMAALAWSLKAWSALVLPEQGRWAEKYRAEKRSLLRMEFSDVLRGDDPGALPDRAGQPVGSSTGCCHGTHGKVCSYGWWSGCTVAGCVDLVDT